MRTKLFGSNKEDLKKIFDKYKAKEPGSLTSQFSNRGTKKEAIRNQLQRKGTITELFPPGTVYNTSFSPSNRYLFDRYLYVSYLKITVFCMYSMTYKNHPLARREAPAEGRRPEGEGANLDRHLVPYHGKQGESNLASSLFIYIYASTAVLMRGIGILALVKSFIQPAPESS